MGETGVLHVVIRVDSPKTERQSIRYVIAVLAGGELRALLSSFVQRGGQRPPAYLSIATGPLRYNWADRNDFESSTFPGAAGFPELSCAAEQGPTPALVVQDAAAHQIFNRGPRGDEPHHAGLHRRRCHTGVTYRAQVEARRGRGGGVFVHGLVSSLSALPDSLVEWRLGLGHVVQKCQQSLERRDFVRPSQRLVHAADDLAVERDVLGPVVPPAPVDESGHHITERLGRVVEGHAEPVELAVVLAE